MEHHPYGYVRIPFLWGYAVIFPKRHKRAGLFFGVYVAFGAAVAFAPEIARLFH